MTMRNVMRAFRFGAGVAPIVAALAGCYAYQPLGVEVRDRSTLEAVAEAKVVVTNTGLNPVRPKTAEGVTDETGLVRLPVAAYNRLLVRFGAPGHAEHLISADHPRSAGDSGWFGPPVNEKGQRATLEIRLTP